MEGHLLFNKAFTKWRKEKTHTPKYSDEHRSTAMLNRDPVQPCVAGKCIQ